MSKIKILLFLETGCGGSERMTVKIGRALNLDIYEPIFVIVGHTTNIEISNFIPSNYKIMYIYSENPHDWMMRQFMSLLKKESPNVIFCSSLSVSCRLILANLISCRSRIIVRCNASVKAMKETSKWFYFGKFTYKLADAVVAQTDEMRQELIDFFKLNPDKLITIHNPIDKELIDREIMSENPYKKLDETIFVTVGRVSPQKAQEIMILALKEYNQKGYNGHLYIVGSIGDNKDYYEGLLHIIKQNNLEKSVTFVGIQKNPYVWIKYSDCFLMSSPVEGLPNALIEASYIGKPLVSTNCAAIINQIIIDGSNGYIVPVGNFTLMAEAMIKATNIKNLQMNYKPGEFEEFANLFNN